MYLQVYNYYGEIAEIWLGIENRSIIKEVMVIFAIHGHSLSVKICRGPRNEICSTHPRTNCHHYNAFS